ncbi:MAG: ComF family protein [Sphingomonadaceae bacterium]
MVTGVQFLTSSLAPLIDFVYPPRCPACGEAIGQQSGLCLDCWNTLVIPTDPGCALCQRPFGEQGPGEGAICAPCMATPPLHDGIAAATLYNATSRKLVLAFKHGGRIALATMLARLMAARLPSSECERVIVPVPLHRWRLWRRGFNQAALLGRELERLGKGKLHPDVLIRRKATPSLGGLSASARRTELQGAIIVAERLKPRVDGRDVVLVDDVLTSGATSTACVKALKRAGARTVTIACFARVLDEALPVSLQRPSE